MDEKGEELLSPPSIALRLARKYEQNHPRSPYRSWFCRQEHSTAGQLRLHQKGDATLPIPLDLPPRLPLGFQTYLCGRRFWMLSTASSKAPLCRPQPSFTNTLPSPKPIPRPPRGELEHCRNAVRISWPGGGYSAFRRSYLTRVMVQDFRRVTGSTSHWIPMSMPMGPRKLSSLVSNWMWSSQWMTALARL